MSYAIDLDEYRILFSGVMMSVKKTDILKTMVHRLERIENLCRLQTSSTKPINQCVHLQDMSGFGPKLMFTPGIKPIII